MTDTERSVEIELSERESVMVQHALLIVHTWNRQEGCEALAQRHNDIRKQFIDAHEEYLND